MVLDAVPRPGAADENGVSDPPPELLEWLRSGRLMLVDSAKQTVPAERWPDLPAKTRAHVVEDFRRVARGGAKAVVLFLRES